MLLRDARGKIQNCHMSISIVRLIKMNGLPYQILTAQNEVKGHLHRLCSVHRQRQALNMKNSEEIQSSSLHEIRWCLGECCKILLDGKILTVILQ
jgi:hypothetical protein